MHETSLFTYLFTNIKQKNIIARKTDEKSGISYVYYYIDNPGNLSVLMLRSNINYTVEKLNDGTIKYGVLDIGTAQDTVKGYKNFGHDADAVVIRYSYWVPSYSFIVKR